MKKNQHFIAESLSEQDVKDGDDESSPPPPRPHQPEVAMGSEIASHHHSPPPPMMQYSPVNNAASGQIYSYMPAPTTAVLMYASVYDGSPQQFPTAYVLVPVAVPQQMILDPMGPVMQMDGIPVIAEYAEYHDSTIIHSQAHIPNVDEANMKEDHTPNVEEANLKDESTDHTTDHTADSPNNNAAS